MAYKEPNLNERDRLRALHELSILDTIPERCYDNLVELTARVCETPIAAISLVDEDRTWSKSVVGLSDEQRNCPREFSFCAVSVMSDEPIFQIRDATVDSYFAESPLVVNDPYIAFYAAANLKTSSGHTVGTLCVLDRVPRELTKLQLETLRTLGDQAMLILETRSQLKESQAEISRIIENSASQSEAYLRATLNSIDAGFIGIDLKGEITICNDAMLKMLGFGKATDIVGKPFEDVVKLSQFNEEFSEAYHPILSTAQLGNQLHSEGLLNRKVGTPLPIEYWVTPTVMNGLLLGAVVSFMDITLRQSRELALALERKKLEEARANAEAANVAKSQFLANISHEIRTPLGAIIGFADVLSAEEGTKDERSHLFDRIKTNGTRLTNLIDDLLDLTKVEANHINIEMVPLDLFKLLTELKDLFAISAAERNIVLKFKVIGELPGLIVSDVKRLRQILVNLIGNALKFTPSFGDVKIIISALIEDDLARLEFRVEDSGPGIHSAQIKKLFQPFGQGDGSITRNYGGSGLGLFVSRRLARLLDGDVEIESSVVGKGSMFKVFINARLTDDRARFISLIESPVQRQSVTKTSNELADIRVLVVEDSPDNRELIRNYLQRAGANPTFAENGREGVDIAMRENFDVVIMDIQMPVLDGNSAMIELRSKGYNKPVIALTAHAMLEDRNHSLKNGFRDYLTKPISRELLISTVKKITDMKVPALSQ